MAVIIGDVALRLREVIAALDRRAPRAEGAGEAWIAQEAAVLRAQAVTRLAEIEGETTEPAAVEDRDAPER